MQGLTVGVKNAMFESADKFAQFKQEKGIGVRIGGVAAATTATADAVGKSNSESKSRVRGMLLYMVVSYV